MMLDILVGVILSLWLGSIEFRMRGMQNMLSNRMEDKNIKEMIDLKQRHIEVKQEDIKEDIKRLEDKIDKLIELNLRQ